MGNYILFVFEGEKTEQLIFNSLTKYFLNESEDTQVCGYWCSDIYDLYERISDDQDLDLFSLIKEQSTSSSLSAIPRDKVSEVYLIFDYDGHATMASDEKIKRLLTLFDNETENGKLYISYPMVEAFRHLRESVEFHTVSVQIAESSQYKDTVHKEGDNCYKNYLKLNSEHWIKILEEHCKKLHYLMTGTFSIPSHETSQINIFKQQEKKYITPKGEVSVLGAFPILVADYYGYVQLSVKIMQLSKNR